MKKLYDLRQYILGLPLNIKSENLEVRADKGKVVAFRDKSYAENKNFSIMYDASILIMDYSASLEELIFYINAWVFANSENYESGDIEYETDILSHSSYDLIIRIADIQEDFIYTHSKNKLSATTIDLDATDGKINYKTKAGYLALAHKD